MIYPTLASLQLRKSWGRILFYQQTASLNRQTESFIPFFGHALNKNTKVITVAREVIVLEYRRSYSETAGITPAIFSNRCECIKEKGAVIRSDYSPFLPRAESRT